MAKNPPHASMTRLLEFARYKTADQRTPVTDWSTLRQQLGVSQGAFTNWKRRGISAEGARTAQVQFGCSQDWILFGPDAKGLTILRVSAPLEATSVPPHIARPDAESLNTYSAERTLECLGLILDRVPNQVRITFAETLAKWAMEGNKHSDDRIASLMALLGEPRKQRA